MTAPEDLLAMAADLGHTETEIGPTETSGRWYCRCACGWGQPRRSDGVEHPVTRTSKREAARTVVHHLQTSVQRYLSDCLRDGKPPSKIKHRPKVT